MSFLTIITRHMYQRPTLFQNLLDSVAQQSNQSFEHLVVMDYNRQGINWANEQFFAHRQAVQGDYVWMVDDDDALFPSAVDSLYRTIQHHGLVPAVIFKGNHHGIGVLPTEGSFGIEPRVNEISGQDLIVRSDIWRNMIHLFTPDYGGDYNFIHHVWNRYQKRIVWLDEVLLWTQQVGMGKPEG